MMTVDNTTTSPLPYIPPLFEQVRQFETIISANKDTADVYFPVFSSGETQISCFPLALLLQGANVDKSHYSTFASIVASYGFIVAVPNHRRTLLIPERAITGLFAQQQQVHEVLARIKTEATTPTSPIFGLLDAHKMAIIGHSFGGAAGLNAILGLCTPPFCSGTFSRPSELKAGVFYGTALREAQSGTPITNMPGVPYSFVMEPMQSEIPTPDLNNNGIPVTLIRGSEDGIATPFDVEETYRQLQTPPKAMVTVFGANHYGMTNSNHPFGAIPDRNPATLKQEMAIETIARWSALSLRAHVLRDAAALDYVYNTGRSLDNNVNVFSEAKPGLLRTILDLVLGLLVLALAGLALRCN